MSRPQVTAVVLAYGDEPVLVPAVEAILSSTGVDVEVVLVDNGCTTDGVHRLDGRPGVRVLRPAENTGFAGGCNLGAAAAESPVLAFVNGDAVVEPDALAHLVDAVLDPGVGLASASIRLADRPGVMNSAGNPVHFSGLSWAGGLGDPATEHTQVAEVATSSGAALAVRREVFDDLGGFCELMFAYCEDTELSLRSWQRGLRCLYVPQAVVLHHYEFSRNPLKMYLLERNRLILVLTLFEKATLLMLAPALLGLELAMVMVALRQGWARQKLSGYVWLLRHSRAVRARRRLVQSTRCRSDADLAPLLTGDFDPGAETGIRAPRLLRRGSTLYWRLVRHRLSRSRSGTAVR